MKKIIASTLILVVIVSNFAFATDSNKLSKEELIQELIKETEFIKDDERFKQFLEVATGETFKQDYLSYPDNTLEDWESMSEYEQAVMTLTELRPRGFILSSNRDIFAENHDVFIEHAYSKPLFLECDPEDGEKVYQAFLKVWDWHWNNYEKNMEYINLYDKNIFKVDDYKNLDLSTSVAEKDSEGKKIETTTSEEDTTEEKATTTENKKELSEKDKEKDKEKETVSEANSSSEKNNNALMPILIIIIIAGIAVFVVFSKKNSNKDNK